MSRRFEELDALRGVAALSVFIYHISLLKTLPFYLKPFKLANGHAAVILFFVLSGFVLSLPILKENKINYSPYLVKRIFRIYFPYLIAITVSIIAATFLSKGPITALGPWFNLSWNEKITADLIIEHILLIGNIHSDVFDNVIWSLIHEIRISLFFPLIVIMVNRLNFKTNILLCLLLSSLRILNNYFYFQTSNGFLITYFDTAHYLAIFIVGTLLAKNRMKLINFIKNYPYILKFVLFFTSIIIYNFSDRLLSFVHLDYLSFNEYITALAASCLIIMSLQFELLREFLMCRPVIYLGKISFSLYLYHVPVLLSIMYIFYGKLPFLLIFIIIIITVLLVSTIAWYFIEKPFMKLGKKLANKLIKIKTVLNDTEEVV